jgi:hypothetical protein
LDRHVLPITGDPEALITALAKLRRLELLPLVAGEEASASSMPAEDWPRLQDLADRAGIPPERLREILDRPGSGDDRYPPLPTSPGHGAGSDSLVFSRTFKRRGLSRQSWTGLAVEIAVPAVVAYVAQLVEWRGVWLAAYLLGLPLTLLLRRFMVFLVAKRGSLVLRRRVRDKLVLAGYKPDAWGARFVGLAPDAEPRNYENFLSWDVGFLVVAGDRLCYLSDRTRFALKREQIQEVYLGMGVPGWRSAQRVYVRWYDKERGVGGTFNLSVNAERSAWRTRTEEADLAKRLHEWLRQPNGSEDVPAPLLALSAPDFGAVASESLGRVANVSILFALLVYRAPFAVGACFLLGLSFEKNSGAGGWYVLVSVALLQVWTVLSFRRYRRRGMSEGDADAPAQRNG